MSIRMVIEPRDREPSWIREMMIGAKLLLGRYSRAPILFDRSRPAWSLFDDDLDTLPVLLWTFWLISNRQRSTISSRMLFDAYHHILVFPEIDSRESSWWNCRVVGQTSHPLDVIYELRKRTDQSSMSLEVGSIGVPLEFPSVSFCSAGFVSSSRSIRIGWSEF